MKTKAFLILASVLLASVSTSLIAEEKITGAFGLKLGQIFDSQSPVVFLSALNDLGVAYRKHRGYSYIFYPDKKFRSFSRYVFHIMPKTRKIYSISAVGDMDDDSTCEKEQALIMAILKKKYGEIKKNKLSGLQLIMQGNRSVSTQCSGLFDVTLDIVYLDSKLADLAEDERIELESSKVDSSGL